MSESWKSLELVTLAEACRLLKVNRVTLYKWEAKGVLRLVRLATRSARVRVSDIERIVSNGGILKGKSINPKAKQAGARASGDTPPASDD